VVLYRNKVRLAIVSLRPLEKKITLESVDTSYLSSLSRYILMIFSELFAIFSPEYIGSVDYFIACNSDLIRIDIDSLDFLSAAAT